MKNLCKAGVFIGLGFVITLMFSLAPTKMQEIPLELFFGDPVKCAYRISPDGNYIGYLALGQTPETKKMLNVWVKSYDKNDDKQITFDSVRPIREYFWAYDSKTVFYLQDKKGDENWSLFSVDKDDSTNTKHLTPFDGSYVRILEYTKDHPDQMLISLNKDNPELHDVYLLNIVSQEIELVEKNTGSTINWYVTSDLELKGSLSSYPDGKQEFFIKNDQGKWESHVTWNYDDTPDNIIFSPNGKFYFIDSFNSSTNQLVEYDPDLKTRTVITGDKEFDIASIFTDDTTGDILAVRFNKIYQEWQVLCPTFEPIYNKLRAFRPGTLRIVSKDQNDRRWIVAFDSDTAPLRYYIYDVESDSSIDLGPSYPELEKYNLKEMKPISFVSRDGLKIHGYLTQSDLKQPAPLVVLVHGGPWERDSWGYNSEAQWLANRGYNVLQINFRGSRGFGKLFEKAGDREWGRKMHTDLLDGIQYLSDQGIVDPKKIAIYGGSYGGYAALAGAAFTPDVFCCAIDLVGPSNLITLLKTIPPYWKLYNYQLTSALGDLETDEALLKERSPLFKADQIKIPVLIGQGANDPRVKQEEAEQIVAALKKHNVPHTYKLYLDEGHGFAHPENCFDFYREMERFLNEHMPVR